MQARWGTHGDYTAIALSPNSVQEMFELTLKAFNLAEKYRTPIVLLADETIAHMRERATLPSTENMEILSRRRPKPNEKAFFGLEEVPPMPSVGEGYNLAVTGSTHNEYGIRFTADPEVHRKLVERLNSKIQNHADEIAEAETRNIEECKIGVVAFGCTSRAIYEAAEVAEEKGVSVGYVRLKTLWPFPEKIVRTLAETAEKIVVPEMNLKQVFYEVQRIANGSADVVPLNKIGGGELITPEELAEKILESAKS
jgi:2-oxoglutarate ferredoxin oxidoreductase subunit alpha